MALWSNTDANTSAPVFAVASGLGVSANGFTLYANTQADAFVTGLNVGVFGVDTTEIRLANNATQKPAHAGWVLRTEGSGGRAGRKQVETLVAMRSVTASVAGDAGDDSVAADS